MEAALLPRTPGDVVLQGISRSFGSQPVLEHVDWKLESGVIGAILGDNGSGKSTLLRILAGLLTPDSGAALLCGRLPGGDATAFVPPGDRGLHWRLTGRQNLSFIARAAGMGRATATSAIEAATAMVDAETLLDVPVRMCSTGQRRRLLLAQSLIAGSPILLLDEPFADLDDRGVARVREVSGYWATNGGVVIAAGPHERDVPDATATMTLGVAA